MPVAIMALAVVGIAGFVFAWRIWPAHDPDEISHGHDDLAADHPHWAEHASSNGKLSSTTCTLVGLDDGNLNKGREGTFTLAPDVHIDFARTSL
jgi:hypothetical protein